MARTILIVGLNREGQILRILLAIAAPVISISITIGSKVTSKKEALLVTTAEMDPYPFTPGTGITFGEPLEPKDPFL
jgi:hypothetical protein